MARHELINAYTELYSVFERALEVGDKLLSVSDEEMGTLVDLRHRLLNKSRVITKLCVKLRVAWEKSGMTPSEKALVGEYRQRIQDLGTDFQMQERKQTGVLAKKVSVIKAELSKGNKKLHVAKAYTGAFFGSYGRGVYRPAV
jgi:hypothetical protein